MKIKLACLMLMLIGLTGCPIHYESKLDDLMSKRPYKDSEKEIARYSSYKIFIEEGSDGPTLNKKRVTPEMMAVATNHAGIYLDAVLDPKSKVFVPLDHVYTIRLKMEKMAQANRCRYVRFLAFDLYQKFVKTLGADAQKGKDIGFDIQAYDPRLLMISNLEEVIPFKNTRIEKARTDNKLKEIQSITVHAKGFFGDRKPNTEEYDYDWLDKNDGYVLKLFKISDQPIMTNVNGDYLELYRLNSKTLHAESKPAIIGFLDGSHGKAIVVMDHDAEGDIGYGLPDEVLEIDEDKILDQETLKRVLQNRFILPKPITDDKPVLAEIVKVGAPTPSEESNVGFSIPHIYSTENKNYHVRIGYNASKKEIRYVIKQFHQDGADQASSDGLVFAYFKAKKPYDAHVIEVKVLFADNTKKVSIGLNDGSIETGAIINGENKFTHVRPFRIDYTDADGIRYTILDENEDGIFEKRMIVKDAVNDDVGLYDEKEHTGVYNVQ